MDNLLKVIEAGNRKIVIGGIGRLFYETGFPIGMSVEYCLRKGLVVSWMHIIDEFLKEGWTHDHIMSKLRDEKADNGGSKWDETELLAFLNADYKKQREMIFNFLFPTEHDYRLFANKYVFNNEI